MLFDFSIIAKKRVPYVPYGHLVENIGKSTAHAPARDGHAAVAPLSIVSLPAPEGHTGHDWTHATLEDMRRASHYSIMSNAVCGHSGHAGHGITDEDIEFFDEHAGIAEFDNGMHRTNAEAQAFCEWKMWRASVAPSRISAFPESIEGKSQKRPEVRRKI